jgi:glucose-6-phosphate isomerase
MDTAALWQRYQDWLYYHAGLGMYLDVSRVRFDDDFVAQITPKFERAFQAIAELEAGAIANPDEGRMVGHYWLRDADLAPNAELKQDILGTLAKIETFTKQIHTGNIYPPGQEHFTDMCFPSALAARPWDQNLWPKPCQPDSAPHAASTLSTTPTRRALTGC